MSYLIEGEISCNRLCFFLGFLDKNNDLLNRNLKEVRWYLNLKNKTFNSPPPFFPMISFAVAAVRGSCCGCAVFFSGYVQIRQPDCERLLPQRGSDGPETSGDGKNQLPHWVLDAKTTKHPSGLSMFSYLHLQAATHFRNSLMKLMEILMSKEPSYVRCIKPNDAKQPGRSEKNFFPPSNIKWNCWCQELSQILMQ